MLTAIKSFTERETTMANKPETIIRSPKNKDNPYTMTLRETAQDSELSWEARGILWYLLSKPDTWEARVEDLERAGCKEGRVKRVLRELIKAGYMQPRIQYRDDKGSEWKYTPYVYADKPLWEDDYADTPIEEIQLCVFRVVENRTFEKRTLIDNRDSERIESKDSVLAKNASTQTASKLGSIKAVIQDIETKKVTPVISTFRGESGIYSEDNAYFPEQSESLQLEPTSDNNSAAPGEWTYTEWEQVMPDDDPALPNWATECEVCEGQGEWILIGEGAAPRYRCEAHYSQTAPGAAFNPADWEMVSPKRRYTCDSPGCHHDLHAVWRIKPPWRGMTYLCQDCHVALVEPTIEAHARIPGVKVSHARDKPKRSAKQLANDALLDALAVNFFDGVDVEVAGTRAGKIIKAIVPLHKQDIADNPLFKNTIASWMPEFKRKYQEKNPGCGLRDAVKFAEHYATWLLNTTPAQRDKPAQEYAPNADESVWGDDND